jgi:hypothetical protein
MLRWATWAWAPWLLLLWHCFAERHTLRAVWPTPQPNYLTARAVIRPTAN